MRYSSHRSETAILSTKCRRRIAAFSSGANVRRARFLLIRDPSLLHRVEPEGVTFQLNRNTSQDDASCAPRRSSRYSSKDWKHGDGTPLQDLTISGSRP